MGFFDRFKKKKNEEEEPIVLDITVDQLAVGHFVDYDLETYTVEKKYNNRYDAVETTEWQLKGGDNSVIYLEMENDDEKEFSVSKKIDYKEVMTWEDLLEFNEEKPQVPQELEYKGVIYYFDEGPLVGVCDGEEYIYAEYWNEKDNQAIVVEQWDETDFEVSHVKCVEEYEFSNIIKGVKK